MTSDTEWSHKLDLSIHALTRRLEQVEMDLRKLEAERSELLVDLDRLRGEAVALDTQPEG